MGTVKSLKWVLGLGRKFFSRERKRERGNKAKEGIKKGTKLQVKNKNREFLLTLF